MSDYENAERFPNRKHPRMRYFDYSSPHYYFVTICTKDRQCLFGPPNQLNILGKYAQDKIKEISKHFSDVTVDKFIVMPNHVHMILILHGNGANLSTVIGQYKAAVSREIHRIHPDMEIWQSSFHDHVIRNQASYEKIWLYIEGNPAKWQDDCFYTNISAL